MGAVFLFGANSMLGWSIYRARPHSLEAFCNGNTRTFPDGIDRGIHLDDELAVSQLFSCESPELIIHCAGVCDVEVCETSPEFAYSVNVDGTHILLDYAPPSARIVYLSSDHIFGGGRGPYYEDSPPAPISVYATTRVAAEALVRARPNTLIIRSGLWIGPSATGRIGHLDWLRDRQRRGLPMTIVRDEVRSAMWAEDAAVRVWQLAQSRLTGVRHIVSERATARPDIAAYLNEHFEIGAQFATQSRSERRVPHLGDVELATRFTDDLALPLRAVVPHTTMATFGGRPGASRR